MKIRCVANTGNFLPTYYLEPRGGYDTQKRFQITLGQDYTVYALALRDNQIWYYICDDIHTYYPVHHPAPLFDVIEKSISKYWIYNFTPNHLDHMGIFAFEEWALDPFFYDRLTDMKDREVEIFLRVKKLMDSECQLS